MPETLDVGGIVVARYHDGSDVEQHLSPRPYLEAVTLGGRPVTATRPADHPHHLGVSFAAPDVDGTSFWGGRTYVRGLGSTLLANHGRQRSAARSGGGSLLRERLEWLAPDGTDIAEEDRWLGASSTEGGWILSWRSRLIAGAGGLSFGSPQTNGRDGAFYGGVFWRAPFDSARVSTGSGPGTEAAHGSQARRLVVEGPETTLVAAADPVLPWFVRAEGYVGFGPALAADVRRDLAPGAVLDLRLAVAVVDGAVDIDRLGRLDDALADALRGIAE